jgi:23S rRNA pseudouridine955/2504/2580 synthase/23S rRNA pseudouridine1911/1915/1917 synthase
MAKLPVLFESADFVAIEKPAGLATIPGRGETDSALEQLARQIGLPSSGNDDPRLRVVHRLDKDTSGVLLWAKNVAAQRHVSHQFQNNRVEKEYLAMVGGTPAEKEGIIEAPIGVHPTDKKRMHVSRHGRPAVTAWRVEQAFRRYALVRCFPKTGKTHQIRVHLMHIGHALAVDPIYSASSGLLLSQFKRGYRPKQGEEERPLINRLTLHAEKLRFEALDGSRIEIIAPPPKDFRVALAQLAKYAR